MAATRVPSRRAWRHTRGAWADQEAAVEQPGQRVEQAQRLGGGEQALHPPAQHEDAEGAGVQHAGADPDLDAEADRGRRSCGQSASRQTTSGDHHVGRELATRPRNQAATNDGNSSISGVA